MKPSSNTNAITFDTQHFYIFMGIFPISLIVACVVISYANGHNSRYRYVPTISEMMNEAPEAGIFSVTMTLEGVFILILGYLRDKLMLSLSKQKNKEANFLLYVILYLSRALAVSSSISMVIFGCSPVRYYTRTHNTAAIMFFVSISLYFAICDLFSYLYVKTPSVLSFSISSIPFIAIIIGLSIGRGPKEGNWSLRYSLTSICEFIAIFFLLIKLIFSVFDYPPHIIQFNKNED